MVDAFMRGMEVVSPIDLNRLSLAYRIPVIFYKKVVHARFVSPEAVFRTPRRQTSRLAPERVMSTSSLLIFFALEFPLSALLVAFHRKGLDVIRDFSLLLPQLLDVVNHLLARTIPFGSLMSDGS